MHPKLEVRTQGGGQAARSGSDSWRLSVPAGSAGSYRLAQLDDYSSLARGAFPWSPPLQMELNARASHREIPGTWGFGLWNDPFGLSLGLGGASRRLPALPNALWVFVGSNQNYLTLYDELPASGPLAGTFRSAEAPAMLLALGAAALPLAVLPPLARIFRRLARRWIQQDAAVLDPDQYDPCQWHRYTLTWRVSQARLEVDGQIALRTGLSPRGPLGIVIWIDNQFAAFPPSGRFAYGTLPNDAPAWLQIQDFVIGPAADGHSP